MEYRSDMKIHGWAVNGSGTRPVHRLLSGRWVYGQREGRRIRWSGNPHRDVGMVYATEEEARAAFRETRHARQG